MRLWFRTFAIFGAMTLVTVGFDYWRREPYRRRARFDSVHVGMTKEQVETIMAGSAIFFHAPYRPPPPSKEKPETGEKAKMPSL